MILRHRLIFSLLAVGLLIGLLGVYTRWVASPVSGNPADAENKTAALWNEPVASSVAPEPESPKVTLHRTVVDQWEVRWRHLTAEPQTAARDEDMATFMEELAAIDPLRAISLAQSETNPELRETLLQATLRGWAGVNLEDAIAWAKTQTLMDQGQAMASVFHGAARDAENAISLAAKLAGQDPARAQDYGSYLIAALSRTGEFSKAAAFAADTPGEFRVDLLNAAYSQWADSQPQAALEHLAQLSDPEMRITAFNSAVSRWAVNDPKAVAEYAVNLSQGSEQTFALSVALRAWSAAEPAEAATWMSRLEPSPQLDFGAAMVALHPKSSQKPDVAISWAESIVDPRLRTRVLATVVNEWAATDPAAARQYAETSPNVRPEERLELLSAFDSDFNQMSLLP